MTGTTIGTEVLKGLSNNFFFKQKSAYEVCGRDWSSDVCSSDLGDSMLGAD